MTIKEFTYNQILYNRWVKIISARLLKSVILLNNPFYNFVYKLFTENKMKQFKDVPHRLMIENTNICNANCIFCPHKIMKRKTGIMGMEMFKRIIDEAEKLKINYVTIYGFGEPLLDKYFFERVEYAKSKGIKRVTTNTNAMYLDKDKIKRILELKLDEIYISFDAATHDTYKKIRPGLNFEIVEQNILNLIKERKKRGLKKPEIILSFVANQDNEKETRKYITKWREKVDHISISFIHNWTGDIEGEKLSTSGRRDPCRLLWLDMVISWNGDVPLCCNDYENRVILGNIKNQSIKKIWGGEKMAKIRSYHHQRNFEKISICKNCEYNYHHKSPWWIPK